MANWSNTLDIMHAQLVDLKGAGLIHKTIEDHAIDGRVVHIDGQKKLNFGSCSYLGLEMHESLKAGAIDAINRYGTQFSSSRSYLETPLYQELESLLNQITGGHTIVTPTTTLAHMAALPALIDERDAVSRRTESPSEPSSGIAEYARRFFHHESHRLCLESLTPSGLPSQNRAWTGAEGAVVEAAAWDDEDAGGLD